MGSVYAARRVDGMASIERAAVFVAAQMVMQALEFVPALAPKGEPYHWYELLLTLGAATVTGLASDLRMPLRIAIGTAALLLDAHLFDMLFDRPEAFDWGQGAAGGAAIVLFTAVLPWLDPPGSLRRWCRRHAAGWMIYYPLAVLLQFGGFWTAILFFVSPILMHDGSAAILMLVVMAALVVPFNALLFVNIRGDARAASGGTVLFLRPLDALPNVEALTQLVDRLAPYRITALDLDRRTEEERDKGWLNAALEVLNVVLWVLLPVLLIVVVINLVNSGFRSTTVRDLVVLLAIGARLYMRSTGRQGRSQRLSGGSSLTRFPTPESLDKMMPRWGRDCGLAVIDLSRETEPAESQIAYLEKTKLARTIVLLPEQAPIPPAVQRLGASVVRYGRTAADLAARLRPALDGLAPRQAPAA